jgi:hypothetical protein
MNKSNKIIGIVEIIAGAILIGITAYGFYFASHTQILSYSAIGLFGLYWIYDGAMNVNKK